MKYLTIASLLFLACAATHTTSAPPPAPDLDTVRVPYPVTVFVHDTTILTTLDSIPYPVDVIHADTVVVPVNTSDTGNIFGTVFVLPTYTGDDWPNLQGAANWQAAHPGCMIKVIADDYQISRPIIFANPQGNDYGQVKVDIEGPVSARNTPKSATFHYNGTTGAAIMVQNCKGCTIKNINFIGQYSFPSTLNVLQIDTLAFAEWPEMGATRTNPYAAIVIDPFSDPAAYDGVKYQKYAGLESYYLPGMSQGGSTAVDIEGCQITNFVVGVMITPSMQANGDVIQLTNSRIDNCKVAYGFSQAQSKMNKVDYLMSWGNTHTIFDGVNYGFPRGDGSTAPFIDGVSLAGHTHQLLDVTAQSFSVSVKRVYGETLYELGVVAQGIQGVHFDDCQINFQNGQQGVPSPPFYYLGTNTTFSSCMLRIYNNNPATRLVFNSLNNVFRDGSIGSPPVCATLNPSQAPPIFEDVTLSINNQMLNRNDYDSLVYVGTFPITVDKSTNTGYVVIPNSGIDPGDLLTTPGVFADYPGQGSAVTPIGFVKSTGRSVSGALDTVFLVNVGQYIQSGKPIDIYDARFKTQ